MTFVILHNMIIESERADPPQHDDHPYYHVGPLAEIDHEYADLAADFAIYLTMNAQIKNVGEHEQLQNDLVEHLWAIRGQADAQID